MTNVTMFMDFDEQSQRALDENHQALQEILHNEKIDASVSYELLPTILGGDARTKDLVPIILASSASILSIAMSVSLIIHVLSRRPVKVKLLEPIHDNEGHLTALVERYEFIQPRPENTTKTLDFGIGLTTGLVVRFSVENQEIVEDN